MGLGMEYDDDELRILFCWARCARRGLVSSETLPCLASRTVTTELLRKAKSMALDIEAHAHNCFTKRGVE